MPRLSRARAGWMAMIKTAARAQKEIGWGLTPKHLQIAGTNGSL
jgi:hypothetical protein